MLILGRDLGAFLQARRWKDKHACRLGETYCVRRRARIVPAGHMAASQAAGFLRLLHEWAEREPHEAGGDAEATRDR